MSQILVRERRFLVASLLFTAALALWATWAYLSWAILGLILARIAAPLQARLSRVVRPRIAGVIVVAGAVLAVAAPLVWIGYVLAGDVARLAAGVSAAGLPALIEEGLAQVVRPETAAALSLSLAIQIERFALALAPLIPKLAFDVTIGIFILGSVTYAGLVERESLTAWVKHILPMRPDREDRLLAEIGKAVDAVVWGVIVVAAVQAALGGLVWWLAGLPGIAFWVLVMFILSMVPALGPFFVMAPAALWAYLTGDLWAAGVLVLGGVVGVGLIDNVLRPLVVGRKGGMHPALVLLSVVSGAVAFGPIGILAGPLVVAVFLKTVELTIETREAFGGDFQDRRRLTPSDPKAKATQTQETPEA